MIEEVIINNRYIIPPGEIQFRFSRSGGPGGQNVNKVSTKVELVFDLAHSSAFDEETKAAVASRLGRHLDSEGILTIASQESRSQFQNRRTAVHKLVILLTKALHVPRKRKDTKPTHSAVVKRLERKKNRSRTKQHRSKKIDLD